jgi:hypothetical protein
MSAEEVSFTAELLGAARGPVRRFPAGRVCEEPGCETRLSIYNSRPRCSVHDFDETLLHFRTVPSLGAGTRGPAAHGRAPAHRPHAA